LCFANIVLCFNEFIVVFLINSLLCLNGKYCGVFG
jgi:hypothetical protein